MKKPETELCVKMAPKAEKTVTLKITSREKGKSIVIILILFVLIGCTAPRYAAEGGNVTMENYAVTKLTYDAAGKVIAKETMIPAKNSFEVIFDKAMKGLESFLDLGDAQVLQVLK